LRSAVSTPYYFVVEARLSTAAFLGSLWHQSCPFNQDQFCDGGLAPYSPGPQPRQQDGDMLVDIDDSEAMTNSQLANMLQELDGK
jgi:hypothetical protein